MKNINENIQSKLWIDFYWHLGEIDLDLESQLGSQLRLPLWSHIRSQLYSKIKTQLKSNI